MPSLVQADTGWFPVKRFDSRDRPLRSTRQRLQIALGVLGAHGLAAIGAAFLPGETLRPAATEELVAVNVKPVVLVSREPIDVPPSIRAPKSALALNVPVPTSLRPIVVSVGIGTMVPRIANPDADSSIFALAAGLTSGQAAMVVLRLEVLASGDLGQIIVEQSGGTPAIDVQAVAYARSLIWTGGMIDGRPATIWIRRAVTLRA